MKYLYLSILIVLSSIKLESQTNLVPNNSFEDHPSLSTYKQLQDGENYDQYWYCISKTPDFIHEDYGLLEDNGSAISQSAENSEAQHGERWLGLYGNVHSPTQITSEGVGVFLKKPLRINRRHKIGFWAKTGDSGIIVGSRIGLYLSDSNDKLVDSDLVNCELISNLNENYGHEGWKYYSFVVCPEKAYTQLVIKNKYPYQSDIGNYVNIDNIIIQEVRYELATWLVGDFNTDNRKVEDDILRYYPCVGIEVLTSTGSEFGIPQLWGTFGERNRGWFVGDFDGDRKDDIFRQLNEHGGAEVLISNGTGFDAPVLWSGAGNRKKGWFVGDFDGDGKDDIFRQLNEHGGAEVLISNGTGFDAPVLWSGAGNRKKGWFVGDFDGDGKDDIFRQLNEYGGAEVLISNGTGFNAPVFWSGAGNRKKGWFVGDFDGDGKDDIFRQLNEHGGAEVLISNGAGFDAPVLWSGAGNRKKGWFVGDFDGDGKDDIFRQLNEHGGAEVLISNGTGFDTPVLWSGAGNYGN